MTVAKYKFTVGAGGYFVKRKVNKITGGKMNSWGIKSVLWTCAIFLITSCGQYESVTNPSKNLASKNLSFDNGSLKASDFVDTGANHSLTSSGSLFNFDTSTGVMMVSTSSQLQDIHSHYADGHEFGNYTYSGALMASQANSGIGVTFLSDYPNADAYYRMSKDENSQTFRLSARNSTACQSVDSGVTAQAGQWYLFKIESKADSTKTTIKAKVWPAIAREPIDVQMTCVDSSASRKVQGTVGLWASGAGSKNWADLYLGFDPYLPPSTTPNPTPADCGTLAHGDSETRVKYQAATVPYGSTCISQVQTRTCNDGVLSAYTPNNYTYDSCSVSPAPPSNEVQAGISSVSASADDGSGNVAANAVDGVLSTRWSASGDGQYIDLVFDGDYAISRVEVAYYKATFRVATFDVQLMINSSLVQVLSDQQSQNTNQLVNYAINNNEAATSLRLVGHGNDQNAWNSISEIVVYGTKLGGGTTPPPAPADCGTLAHGDSETRTKYQASSVPSGSTCVSEVQTRTCNNGVLSAYTPNNYQYDSCTVSNPTPPPAPDQDNDGIPDSSDPCPTDPTNACQSGTPIANANALSTAIAGASGGEVFLLAPGNYGQLTLKNRNYSSKVTIKSANPANPASFSALRINNSSQVILDGLYFDYTFQAGQQDHHNMFSAYDSNNLVVINSTFDGDFASGTGSFRDGFGTGRGVIFARCQDINFINNEIRKFWKGISMGAGGNYRFIGNDIHTIRSDGFNSGTVDGLTVEKNYFHDFKSAANSPDHRDMIQILRSSGNDSRNIDIKNNIFDMAAGDYAQVIWSGTDGTSAQLHNVLVEGNVIYNAHANGIAFHNVNGMTIRKNTMVRVPRAQTGGVSIPKIGSNGTNIVIDRNVISSITTPNAILSNNVYIQDTNPSGAGYFDNEFIYYAKSATHGYNEFGIKPGSQIEALDAGSDIMKLYPIGKGNTLNVLRNLP